MFRIRRVYDDVLPNDRTAVEQVQEILRSQFGALSEADIKKLPLQLRNPLKFRFRTILHIAEGSRRLVKGFALMMHAPDLHFSYLDFLASDPKRMGSGTGGALYEGVRAEARALRSIGLFFECLPDDPDLCHRRDLLKENSARLRFYERYGARPIIHTAYETPISPDGDCPPYLVFDGLGLTEKPSAEHCRAIVRAILERKYGSKCPVNYIEKVVASFKDDPIRLREPRYARQGKHAPVMKAPRRSMDQRIGLVVSDRHQIHHVTDRGYVESPVRIRSILKELEKTDLFERLPIRHFSKKYVTAVHNRQFVEYLKAVCAEVAPDKSVYPYVFPIRNATRPPKDLPVRAGYFCMDVFTPLNQNAYHAARRSVDCALTAAQAILEGYRMAYALVRPPGHHAERHVFGGFCYFNSAAIAAHYLCRYGRTAILDIDYHHGNGAQDIFYDRSDVLTVSIHGHPRFAYPYFSGFEDEKGEGPGKGYNLNIPLPEVVNGVQYREALRRGVRRIRRFRPVFLIVALGLDPAKNDPTGTWLLTAGDFFENGKLIGGLNLRTLIVQEGGYRVRSLGVNARHFFSGLTSGAAGAIPARTPAVESESGPDAFKKALASPPRLLVEKKATYERAGVAAEE
jgi:acetoin utilization deacetylase AcuC-like enzyme